MTYGNCNNWEMTYVRTGNCNNRVLKYKMNNNRVFSYTMSTNIDGIRIFLEYR